MIPEPPPEDQKTLQTQKNWSAGWHLLIALDIVLAVACVCWMIVAGIGKAFESNTFAYLGIATILLIMLISGRTTVQLFNNGFVIDKRNYMYMSRTIWFRKRGQL